MHAVATMATKIDVFMLKSTFRIFGRQDAVGGFCDPT